MRTSCANGTCLCLPVTLLDLALLRPTCHFEASYSERVGASEQSVRSAEWTQT